MIHATVDGNVGSHPELRHTAGGKAVCSFSLASTMKVGQDKHTTWLEVTCWDEMAETVMESVSKGKRVLVTGRMSIEEFSRKDGTKGSKLKLVADDLGVSLRWPSRESAGAGRAAGRNEKGDAGDDAPF
jgi:single-strand DNA-binding protein